MASKNRAPDFERSLAELEALVKKLEDGQLPLEDSLKQFERAMALAKICQTALNAAEQKIETITAIDQVDGDDAGEQNQYESPDD